MSCCYLKFLRLDLILFSYGVYLLHKFIIIFFKLVHV
nr:MAG TPA: hypothetical protein [Bacteriophage sp.]DAR41948.1 MAG TPA: hypothetical protein [Bacteriophage sp.]